MLKQTQNQLSPMLKRKQKPLLPMLTHHILGLHFNFSIQHSDLHRCRYFSYNRKDPFKNEFKDTFKHHTNRANTYDYVPPKKGTITSGPFKGWPKAKEYILKFTMEIIQLRYSLSKKDPQYDTEIAQAQIDFVWKYIEFADYPMLDDIWTVLRMTPDQFSEFLESPINIYFLTCTQSIDSRLDLTAYHADIVRINGPMPACDMYVYHTPPHEKDHISNRANVNHMMELTLPNNISKDSSNRTVVASAEFDLLDYFYMLFRHGLDDLFFFLPQLIMPIITLTVIIGIYIGIIYYFWRCNKWLIQIMFSVEIPYKLKTLRKKLAVLFYGESHKKS